MECRYYITAKNERHLIDKSDLVNWGDIKFSLSREGHSGVVRSFTSSFKFTGTAASLLNSIYLKGGLYSEAGIEVWTKDNRWTYNKEFACPFDFSTFKINSNGTISLNAIDNSLAAIIKAKKGIRYDIPMRNLTVPGKPFLYKGVKLDNALKFKLGGDAKGGTTSTFITLEGGDYQKLPVSLSEEQIVKDIYLSWKGQSQEVVTWKQEESGDYGFPIGTYTQGDNYMVFSEFAAESGIESESQQKLRISARIDMSIEGATESEVQMFLCTGNTNGEIVRTPLYTWVSVIPITYNETEGVWKTADNAELTIHDGMKLMLVAKVPQNMKFIVKDSNIVVTWDAVFPEMELNYTKPERLLNAIMEKMVEGKQQFTATIENGAYSEGDFGSDGDFRLPRTLIIPSDSVHRISEQKIYASFSDFCTWMSSVFGFIYTIDGNNIKFCHRNAIFPDSVETSGDMTDVIKSVGSSNEVEYSVDSNTAFSVVSVSYSGENSGEEDFNKRYDTCRKADYTTGIVNSSKKMDLPVPWKCSCIEMEKEYQRSFSESGEKEIETSEGVFFVLCKEDVKNMVPDISPVVRGPHKNGMFNYLFSPIYCLMANQRYIASFVNQLKLSSTMIPLVSIDRLNLKKSIDKDDPFFLHPLMTSGVVSFKTDDMEIPSDLRGIVEVRSGGMVYRGYVEEITAKYEREENASYKLYVKNIRHDTN